MKLLLAGFVLSLLGSLPPGLISLSVAYTVISRGFAAAVALGFGAAFAEFFQAWLAVLLSDWFLSHPIVEKLFAWVAAIVFFSLSIYLIFFAETPKISAQSVPGSRLNQFAKGLIISSFNLLAIPYWFVYCAWLKVEGWWQDSLSSTMLFCSGVTLGTIFALTLYAWLGVVILQKARQVAVHANRLVGIIFLALALKLLWRLVG